MLNTWTFIFGEFFFIIITKSISFFLKSYLNDVSYWVSCGTSVFSWIYLFHWTCQIHTVWLCLTSLLMSVGSVVVSCFAFGNDHLSLHFLVFSVLLDVINFMLLCFIFPKNMVPWFRNCFCIKFVFPSYCEFILIFFIKSLRGALCNIFLFLMHAFNSLSFSKSLCLCPINSDTLYFHFY